MLSEDDCSLFSALNILWNTLRAVQFPLKNLNILHKLRSWCNDSPVEDRHTWVLRKGGPLACNQGLVVTLYRAGNGTTQAVAWRAYGLCVWVLQWYSWPALYHCDKYCSCGVKKCIEAAFLCACMCVCVREILIYANLTDYISADCRRQRSHISCYFSHLRNSIIQIPALIFYPHFSPGEVLVLALLSFPP